MSAHAMAQDYIIRIDREGRWFYNGNQIIHPSVLKVFNEGLFLGEDNNHYLRVQDDIAYVEVDDTPFVVRSVGEIERDGALLGFRIGLSDGTDEALDLATLEIDRNNVPYCRVRKGMKARFTSQAYYMLAEHIEYDERRDAYFICSGSAIHTIIYHGQSQ
jgi:uncharacterized protein